MKERLCTVLSRREAGESIVVLELRSDIAKEVSPGQFLNLAVPGVGFDPFLRRPYSVSWVDLQHGTLELLLQIRGRGSRGIAALREGDRVSALGPLGKGFPVERLLQAKSVDLVAGACGVAPLLFLAQTLGFRRTDIKMRFFVGAKTKHLIPEPQQLQKRFPEITFATEDGSFGYHGTVFDCYRACLSGAEVICGCGPTPLLERLRSFSVAEKIPCFLSLETQMACGFGVCQGCVVRKPEGGYQLVCKDGPVFEAAQLPQLT